jgi:aminomethyltransferase
MSATPSNDALRKLPLEALHRELGAKFGAFAGYDMPIQYGSGVKQEHLHTRRAATLFDVSHMGQLSVRAKDGSVAALHAGLEAALPVDFVGWPLGVQRYTVLLNQHGGIEDDVMLTNLGDEVRIVVNAGNRDSDLLQFHALCPALNFSWIDASLLAIQGPTAEAVLSALNPRAAELRFMETAFLPLEGATCFVTRSGYTGEDGYELSIPAAHATRVARKLLGQSTVMPAGLAARDTLRLEAGLPLHGHDISLSTTPVEAGLPFAIAKSRRLGGAKAGDFPGAAIVLQQLQNGCDKTLVGLRAYDNIPVRAHTVIETADGGDFAEVTSGTMSPSLGFPIVMAYLPSAWVNAHGSATQHAVFARVRDKRPRLEQVTLPFVAKRYKR